MTRKRFVTFFPRLRPIAIHKDVGQIPFFAATHLGWEASLFYVQIEDGVVADKAFTQVVETRCLGFGDSRIRRLGLFARALQQQGRNIDVLNLYQLGTESALLAKIYKTLNPAGIVFLKLDMDEPTSHMLIQSERTIKRRAVDCIVKAAPFDFFTVETKRMLQRVEPYFGSLGHKVMYLPNGFTAPSDMPQMDKENVILHVGRLGTQQKNSELLLEAISDVDPSLWANWKLFLVGPATEQFLVWLDRFTEQRPWLRDRICTVGEVSDRRQLYTLYKRARIFVLSSRWESSGLVLLEAARFGCFIVSTDVGAASDITLNGTLGSLVPTENRTRLAEALAGAVVRTDIDEIGSCQSHHVASQYSWEAACDRLRSMCDA